jgi:23S rRNA (adenine2503-C2)-methyltransferase
MSNLPLSLRKSLEKKYSLNPLKIVERKLSSDGTEKFLVEVFGNETIEMVYIPEGERGTICISSQIGCNVKCSFCLTGTQKFSRNLEVPEIVGQVLLMREFLGDKGSLNSKRILTNIVVMGMGEPLHNYNNISKALKIIMDPDGLAFSKRRITLSTSGVAPFIKKCGEELGVNLAISLHASNNKLRDSLIPINKQFPLEVLIENAKNYPGINQAHRLTFEYVMLSEVNDSDKNAKEIIELIKEIPSKINLLPWNPWHGAPFKTSSKERLDAFAKILIKAGIYVTVRTPRGQDISAACGQLRSKTSVEPKAF